MLASQGLPCMVQPRTRTATTAGAQLVACGVPRIKHPLARAPPAAMALRPMSPAAGTLRGAASSRRGVTTAFLTRFRCFSLPQVCPAALIRAEGVNAGAGCESDACWLQAAVEAQQAGKPHGWPVPGVLCVRRMPSNGSSSGVPIADASCHLRSLLSPAGTATPMDCPEGLDALLHLSSAQQEFSRLLSSREWNVIIFPTVQIDPAGRVTVLLEGASLLLQLPLPAGCEAARQDGRRVKGTADDSTECRGAENEAPRVNTTANVASSQLGASAAADVTMQDKAGHSTATGVGAGEKQTRADDARPRLMLRARQVSGVLVGTVLSAAWSAGATPQAALCCTVALAVSSGAATMRLCVPFGSRAAAVAAGMRRGHTVAVCGVERDASGAAEYTWAERQAAAAPRRAPFDIIGGGAHPAAHPAPPEGPPPALLNLSASPGLLGSHFLLPETPLASLSTGVLLDGVSTPVPCSVQS